MDKKIKKEIYYFTDLDESANFDCLADLLIVAKETAITTGLDQEIWQRIGVIKLQTKAEFKKD